MRHVLLSLCFFIVLADSVWAIPETVSLRITDVTTSSFSVVWMTDVAAEPAVEVYADSGMATSLNDMLMVTPMPDLSPQLADAARRKGIMKVRVSGLVPNSRCYVRTVSSDPADPSSIGYSPLQEVNTAVVVRPYLTAADGTHTAFANDLLAFVTYIRPADSDFLPGAGDLLLLELNSSASPVSAFVGTGAVSREGIIDLNNLFGADAASLKISGSERILVRVYRGESLTTLAALESRIPLPTLQHYRRLPVPSGVTTIQEPVQGFFADTNLDGKVDVTDFSEFKKHYRTVPDDVSYNPDYEFIVTPGGRIDAQDFARFAREFGRSDVP